MNMSVSAVGFCAARHGIKIHGRPKDSAGKHACWFCFQYFIAGRTHVSIAREIGMYADGGKSTGVNAIYKKLFPSVNFLGRSKTKLWLSAEQIAEVKRLHVDLGLGHKEIRKRLGFKSECKGYLSKQSWYDPKRGSNSNTIKLNKPIEVRLRLELDRKRGKKVKLSKRVNDLPLFDWALKNKVSQPKPRASLSEVELLAVRKREIDRYHNDDLRWIKVNMRKRLNKFVSGIQKVSGFENYAGCTKEELRDWIEHQFQDGMSWSNKGEWHLDHIIPCSYFDLQNQSHQKVCFNWRNIRPLWARENICKGDCMVLAQSALSRHKDQQVVNKLLSMVAELGLELKTA
jgi:hypothetical protein